MIPGYYTKSSLKLLFVWVFASGKSRGSDNHPVWVSPVSPDRRKDDNNQILKNGKYGKYCTYVKNNEWYWVFKSCQPLLIEETMITVEYQNIQNINIY